MFDMHSLSFINITDRQTDGCDACSVSVACLCSRSVVACVVCL